jgi:CRP-like cAMP-binding protein
MQVARLGVGEILGEMSLMSANKTRQASVFASEEGCSLVVFPAYPLQMLLDVPAMSSSLARRYAQNINRLSAMQMAHKQTK